jgi:hypothetical protein
LVDRSQNCLLELAGQTRIGEPHFRSASRIFARQAAFFARQAAFFVRRSTLCQRLPVFCESCAKSFLLACKFDCSATQFLVLLATGSLSVFPAQTTL